MENATLRSGFFIRGDFMGGRGASSASAKGVAWEGKPFTDKQIGALENAGAKRWSKGGA